MSLMPSSHLSILSIQSGVLHGAVGNTVAALIYPAHGLTFLRLDSLQMAAHPGFGSKNRLVPRADAFANILDDYQLLIQQDSATAMPTGIHTGYLASAEQAEMLAEKIASFKAQAKERHSVTPLYLLDPVLGDDARFYVDPAIGDIMRDRLVPLADILTPNQFELSVLTNQPCLTHDHAIENARHLMSKGPDYCFVTGCVEGEHTADLLVTPSHEYMFTYDKRPQGVSGAGDALASLFFALYLSGAAIEEAAEHASKATQYLIKKATDPRSLPLFSVHDIQEALTS